MKSERMQHNRKRLTIKVIEDVLASWHKNGASALEITFREAPSVYLRTICSLLPKEMIIEDVMSDVSDEQLDTLMERIKEHLLTARSKRGDEDKASDDQIIH